MNGDGAGGNSQAVPAATSLQENIASIEKLPDFERLVLIMTVLEHISIQDCALLLARSLKEVWDAQKRAKHLLAFVAHGANASFKHGPAERYTCGKQFEN
jgi:DNA-directed RNA polymerase specialized sigma24 family protein